jgi:hypothetical protein
MVEFDLDGTTKRVQFLREPGRQERYAAHSGIPPRYDHDAVAGIACGRHDVTMSASPGAQDAETILSIVVGYSLDKACQHFPGIRVRTHAHHRVLDFVPWEIGTQVWTQTLHYMMDSKRLQ